ncbi:MAG: hypothetical protein K0Q68_309 [Moraxellaceae bacterium]|jgi:hypothetical protein|nr:hypothetical protein [Moraxellaceae bacterium]
MTIVVLLLGLVAIFAVFTYYLAIIMLWGLALLGIVIMGISAAIGSHYGELAGYATALVLVGALLGGWLIWQKEQETLERQRREKEEQLRRAAAEREQAYAAERAQARKEAVDAARQRPWQDRSADDWLKVWFS